LATKGGKKENGAKGSKVAEPGDNQDQLHFLAPFGGVITLSTRLGCDLDKNPAFVAVGIYASRRFWTYRVLERQFGAQYRYDDKCAGPATRPRAFCKELSQ
jgi:hypothetical protein